MAREAFHLFLLPLVLGVAVCGTSLLQDLETDPDTPEWVRVPSEVGEWIWTHRRSLEVLLARQRPRVQLADVEFWLHTSPGEDGRGHRVELVNGEFSLAALNFQPERPTRVIVHGWLNSKSSPFVERIREAYLSRGDYNVIVVDWSACAKAWNYVRAVRCVPVVGEALAMLLDELRHQRDLQLARVYIVGHSLGAHIAGIAGKRIQPSQIDTIVALDPALPLFSMSAPENRISARDARYVEVIHTNGGLFGFLQPLGTADFYVNGGTHQPGCALPVEGMCSHSRAWELFVETLDEPEDRLLASKVNSLEEVQHPARVTGLLGWDAIVKRVKMGGEPSSHARGLFYINTRERSPFFER